MPPPIGDDELNLRRRARRRLIGAVALVLLLVFLLPKVLEKEPRTIGDKVEIHYSDKPAASEPVVAPENQTKPESTLAPAPTPATAPSSATEATSGPPAAHSEPEPKPGEAPVVAATPAPPEHKKPESAPKPAAKRETFYVQVGVFSKVENARQVKERLAQNAIKSLSDTVHVAAGDRTRIRVGPFDTRAAAEAMLARVKLAGEHEARIAVQKVGG